MTDDIVTRLREEKLVVTNGVRRAVPIDPIYIEAADEIQHLRAERDKWFHLARRLYAQHGKRSMEIMELAHVLAIYEQAHEQAVRGE